MKGPLAEAKKQLDEIGKNLKEHGKKEFQEYFAEFFKKHRNVEAIRWQQFTPYFNDGDECHFGVHGVYAKISGLTPEPDWDDGFSYYPDEIQEVVNDLDSIPEILLQAFGDHVEITATRDGIEVEPYEHE